MPKNSEVETKNIKNNVDKMTDKEKVSKNKSNSKSASTKKQATNKKDLTNGKTKSENNSSKSKKKVDTTTKKNVKPTTNLGKAKVEKKETVNKIHSEKLKKELSKKVEDAKKSTPKQENNEIGIIDRIKNFIAKIAEMQQEAIKDEMNTSIKGSKNSVVSKNKKSDSKKAEYMLEYYDLPYRYNETTVKILAQTPKKIFVYWDISDKDREKYIKTFGDDFFYKTYPVLLLYDKDRSKVREIRIDDFANSWYIDIDDPKTKYTIQLGRKFREKPTLVNFSIVEKNEVILHNDYLPFANSNVLEVPNDHILLEKLPQFVTFRNVKTNQETYRELKSFKDVFGNNYDVEEFYKENYGEEIVESGMFDMKNPSSNTSSSSFK